MDQGARDARADAAMEKERRDTAAWQRRLLPLMAGMLIALAVFACASSIYQVGVMQRQIQEAHTVDLTPAWELTGADRSAPFADRFASAQWRMLALLEAEAIRSRYHQASVAMMGRVYIIFLGFATGMVMALVGATFILGKLREAPAETSVASGSLRLALRTTSPGLLLAFLGTILMLATVWARSDVTVRDGALYLPNRLIEPPAQASAAAADAAQRRTSLLEEARKVELEKAQAKK